MFAESLNIVPTIQTARRMVLYSSYKYGNDQVGIVLYPLITKVIQPWLLKYVPGSTGVLLTASIFLF